MKIHTQELLAESMIREINRIVRSGWTKKELSEGKELIFLWEDIEVVKEVIPKFIDKGWVIKKKQALCESSGRKIILSITKPPYDEYFV